MKKDLQEKKDSPASKLLKSEGDDDPLKETKMPNIDLDSVTKDMAAVKKVGGVEEKKEDKKAESTDKKDAAAPAEAADKK